MKSGTINRCGMSDFTATVKAIFDAEGTDKARSDGLDKGRVGKALCWHHYQDTYASQFLRLYARHLRGEQVRVAEIGVASGASTRAMQRILPFAELYGFDVSPCKLDLQGVTIVTGDAYAEEAWKSAPADFDLIIDDGSHRVEDMLRGIPVFVNHLRSGGVLMIEDIRQPDWAGAVMNALPGSELVDTRDEGGVDDLTVMYQRPPAV